MADNWISNEFKAIDLGDKRLNERAADLLTSFAKAIGNSIPETFRSRSEAQAAYRFLSNDLVDSKKIINPHKKATIERIEQFSTVLVLGDTTSLNYTTRKSNPDSGYLSGNNAQGFYLHQTIAVTPERLHLGVVDGKLWSREKKKKVKGVHRDFLPIEEKESYRWLESYRESHSLALQCPDTRFVHITDREGDIIEVLQEASANVSNGIPAHLLVRCNHNRALETESKTESGRLFERLEEAHLIGSIEFEAIDRETGSKRSVSQVVKAATVKIKVSSKTSCLNKTIKMNTILLKELDPPEGKEPIIWRLLTTLPIATLEDIREIIIFYLCRWEIEIHFKTFKSGCKVEKKSLRTSDRLFPLFTILMIVAWRVNYLLHIGRIVPELSCAFCFEKSEWKAGTIAATRDNKGVENPPSMRDMMMYVAMLGGYKGPTKTNPVPGPTVIWRGLNKLGHYADAWDLFGPDSMPDSDPTVKNTYA